MNASSVNTAEVERRYASGRGLLALWTGVLLAPLVWALHLSVSYFLASFLCESRWNLLLLATSALSLALAAVGLWFAWSNYRNTGREWPRGDVDGILVRSRFLAVGGMILSGLSMLLIVAQTIPMLVLEPCR